MKCNATWNVGEDGMAILVDGEKKIASWSETEAGDVLAVGKWKGMRLIAMRRY